MSTTPAPTPRIGRPPHEPTKQTRDTVRLMSAAGVRQDLIADCLGIDDTTLRKHYKREIKLALAEITSGVFGSLFKKAMSPDHPQAAISAMFLLKTRAGYSEKLALIGGSKDDPPVRVAHDVDLSALNRDQLMALLTLADTVLPCGFPNGDEDVEVNDAPLADLVDL